LKLMRCRNYWKEIDEGRGPRTQVVQANNRWHGSECGFNSNRFRFQLVHATLRLHPLKLLRLSNN
jgi:hypothetical protein